MYNEILRKEENILVEVKNLTKRYGKKTVVDHLSFTLEDGKIYGFLGPNGAGKTTTMNMMTGCLAPTEGEVKIFGCDIVSDPINAKKNIGYLPEIPPLYPDMTPLEYLMFVCEAKGIKNTLEESARVMELTDTLDVADKLIKNLSKGYRQRVGIAQALLGSPKLVILDEPTVGLDPHQIVEIRELILSLREHGTVLISSHILSEIGAICDKIMIISGGKMLAFDTLENVLENKEEVGKVRIVTHADEASLRAVLDGLGFVAGYFVNPSAHDAGAIEATILSSEDRDIREELSAAFGEAKIALLSLEDCTPSLEDVFIRMTDADVSEEESANESADMSDESDDDDDDDDSDDDYTPLFGGKKSDGDGENK